MSAGVSAWGKNWCGLLLLATDVARSVVCVSVWLCVGHVGELCKNGWIDRDAVWKADSCGSKEPRIRWHRIFTGPILFLWPKPTEGNSSYTDEKQGKSSTGLRFFDPLRKRGVSFRYQYPNTVLKMVRKRWRGWVGDGRLTLTAREGKGKGCILVHFILFYGQLAVMWRG